MTFFNDPLRTCNFLNTEFPGLAGGSHHAFSPWLPEVGEGLRLLATSGGETNTGTPMRPRKMPRQLVWWICGCICFKTVDGKRDRNLDVWLVVESLGNVWCWMSLPIWCQSEAGEAEFCRSWSSGIRREIILAVAGNVGNVDGGTWREKFQVICIIQKTIPLMDKLPETQLIWQAHLNIASSKEKKDTF